MTRQVSAVQITTSPEERSERGSDNGAGAPDAMSPLAVRMHGEYREMPGLRLTAGLRRRRHVRSPVRRVLSLVRALVRLGRGGARPRPLVAIGARTDSQELEASVPGLRASRQLLVIIPASLEEHPRVVDLLRDGETLPRLRRVHHAFGEALRKEHVSREIDSLDP